MVSGLARPMVHHRPTPVTAPKTVVIRTKKRVRSRRYSSASICRSRRRAADEIGEQDTGADGELRDDHMGDRDQRNEHRRGDEWHVPDREFHNELRERLFDQGFSNLYGSNSPQVAAG